MGSIWGRVEEEERHLLLPPERLPQESTCTAPPMIVSRPRTVRGQSYSHSHGLSTWPGTNGSSRFTVLWVACRPGGRLAGWRADLMEGRRVQRGVPQVEALVPACEGRWAVVVVGGRLMQDGPPISLPLPPTGPLSLEGGRVNMASVMRWFTRQPPVYSDSSA